MLDALRSNDGQAIRLLPARGNLGEELIGCDACRRGQAGRGGDLVLDSAGDRLAEGLSPHVLGDVEIRLVERERFDERRHAAKDGEDRLRCRTVPAELW